MLRRGDDARRQIVIEKCRGLRGQNLEVAFDGFDDALDFAGCLVERYRDQILQQIPEVDAVVGTGEVERIIEAVEGDLKILPAQPPAFLYHDLTPRIITTPKHQAYIKIAEGCDHPCPFCTIPHLRAA